MMKNNDLNMNKKILIYLIIFSFAIIFVIYFSQVLFTNFLYERYTINDINEISKKIKNTDSKKVEDVVEKYAYKNNMCAQIIESDSKIINVFNQKLGCPFNDNQNNIKVLQMKFISSNKNSNYTKLIDYHFKVKSILYSVKKDDKYIFFYTQLQDVNESNILLKNQLIYLIVIILLIAILISYFISKKISNPILKLTKESRKLTTKEFNPKDIKTDSKEINELVETLVSVQEELLKMDDLKRDLMANVSHDLKTPLTMIKAYAEMIRDISYENPDKMNEHLEIIISECDRLNILVNDILNLSTLQSFKETLNKEEFDLVKEVKTILKKYEIIKVTENYKFILNSPKKALVNADKFKINQVLYNLINNAINYTGKDNKVTINILDEKDKYKVEIIDTGKGIEKKDIKYIWNKYYKNDKFHQRAVVGSGIGLSIVKEVLSLHNFEYGVESKKNKGTKFYFYISK